MDGIKAVLKRGIARVALAVGLGALLVGPAGCVVIVPGKLHVEEERVIRAPCVATCEPAPPPVIVVPICTPVAPKVVVPTCEPAEVPVIVVPTCQPEVICPTQEVQVLERRQVVPTVCPTQAALTRAPVVVTATPRPPVTPEVRPTFVRPTKQVTPEVRPTFVMPTAPAPSGH